MKSWSHRIPIIALTVTTIVLGCLWSFGTLLQPIFRLITEKSDISDYFFTLIFFPSLAIPGVMALFFGICLLRRRSKTNIKGSVGAIAIMGAFFLAPIFNKIIPEDTGYSISFFIATILVIPLYIAIAKFFILREGKAPLRKGEFVGRGIITLLGIMIWLVLNQIIMEYAPVEQGFKNVKEFPWRLLASIAPFIIALLFYKVALTVLKKQEAAERAKHTIKIESSV